MRNEYDAEHKEISDRLRRGESFAHLMSDYKHIWSEKGIESISQAALYFTGEELPYNKRV